MAEPVRHVSSSKPVEVVQDSLRLDRMRRLNRMRTVARLLDTAIRVPGTRIRFGADSIIGLIPGIGDVATGVIALYLVAEAVQMNLPRHVLLRMLGNIGIDAAVGSIPLAGDIFDVVFKANRRNLALVERYLLGKATVHR